MSSSAFDVMNSWGDKAHAKNGFGGSQLATGLAKMSKDNPFVFSAAVGSSFYKHLKAVPEDKLQYVSEMGGIALERLTAGKTAKDVDAKGVSLASEIKGKCFSKKWQDLEKHLRSGASRLNRMLTSLLIKVTEKDGLTILTLWRCIKF